MFFLCGNCGILRSGKLESLRLYGGQHCSQLESRCCLPVEDTQQTNSVQHCCRAFEPALPMHSATLGVHICQSRLPAPTLLLRACRCARRLSASSAMWTRLCGRRRQSPLMKWSKRCDGTLPTAAAGLPSTTLGLSCVRSWQQYTARHAGRWPGFGQSRQRQQR